MVKSEMETIINYNQLLDTASVFTFDKKLINKIEKLRENDTRISLLREGDGWKEYILPKRAIKIRMPRELSEEERVKLADRMKNTLRKDD